MVSHCSGPTKGWESLFFIIILHFIIRSTNSTVGHFPKSFLGVHFRRKKIVSFTFLSPNARLASVALFVWRKKKWIGQVEAAKAERQTQPDHRWLVAEAWFSFIWAALFLINSTNKSSQKPNRADILIHLAESSIRRWVKRMNTSRIERTDEWSGFLGLFVFFLREK